MLNFIHGNGRDHRSKQITAAMGQALAVFRCRQAYISLAFTCAATAWISPQRVWIDYISLSSYLVRSKIWKSVPTISAKQHQPSEDQLISMVLVFVNSLTTVITVFAFYNTQLSFFFLQTVYITSTQILNNKIAFSCISYQIIFMVVSVNFWFIFHRTLRRYKNLFIFPVHISQWPWSHHPKSHKWRICFLSNCPTEQMNPLHLVIPPFIHPWWFL